jgi:uncharacterized membrane protein
MFGRLISATDGVAQFRDMKVRRSMPNKPELISSAQGSILVGAPIGSVYRQWLRIEDFPQFMPAVKDVQKLDGGHFAIVASLNGNRHEGVLEIMLRVPERRLAWRVLAGRPSNYLASGVVSLTSRPDRSTRVILKICPGFNGSVSRRMHSYLRNFKRFMERLPNGVLENENPRRAQWGGSAPHRIPSRHEANGSLTAESPY